MKVKIILNPYAGRWGAQTLVAKVDEAFTAAGVQFDLATSNEAGECVDLATDAAGQDYDAIVAAGGDGTLNEVLNGVLSSGGGGPDMPMGVLPLGSANDFATIAKLPLDLHEAARVIAAGHVRRVDVGSVNGRYFINNSAAAMEPMVTLESHKITRLSGESRYMAALLKAIIKVKAWRMNVEWDDGRYDGPAILLSVCNSSRTGGFTMAPGAEIDDGLLDLVLVPEVSKLTLVRLLVRLMQGQHVQDPRVTFVRTSQIKVTSQPGTPAHADGEVFGESVVELEYKTLPQRVALLSSS